MAGVALTGWSVWWDVRAYRAWRQEREGDQPRWKRRQREKNQEAEDREAQRWRWFMLSLVIAIVSFVAGTAAVAVGYVQRWAWAFVLGGNLLVIGLLAWLAYQLVLPKPEAVRAKLRRDRR